MLFGDSLRTSYVLLERSFFFKLRWIGIGRLPAAASGCFPRFRIHDVMW